MKISKYLCFLMFFGMTLTGCDKKGDNSVPKYEGMTVSHNKSRLVTRDGGEDEEEVDNHQGHEETIENDIEDIVNIDVKTDEEVKYYVNPNETFIVEIHLSNPKEFEIQSFTLNGKKYANYMFKEGSTMELLLLEVTAPDNAGFTKYTIDAIKYIDGTQIKDVDMSSGNKSIKCGVAHKNRPTAEVTSYSVNTTYVDLWIKFSDPERLTKNFHTTIQLSDGNKIIKIVEIKVGDNYVRFSNLKMSTTYQYAVVTGYDFIDGKDYHTEWILKNTFTTLRAYQIVAVIPTKDSISFSVVRTGEVGTVRRITLYDATTNRLIKDIPTSQRVFNNLLSDHTYNIYVDFNYQSNGKTISDWVSYKDIHTLAKIKPIISLDSPTSDKTSVNYNISCDDADSILVINKVELLRNGEVVKNNGSLRTGTFNNLLSNNQYSVKVSYSYDLNDGSGAVSNTIEKSVTTVAKVQPSISYEYVNSDKTSITYNVNKTDVDEILSIDKVELLKNGNVVKNNGTILNGTFNNLLSNNEYSIKVSYTYDLNDGNGAVSKSITTNINTEAKLSPTVQYDFTNSDKTSISYNVATIDSDEILSIDKVELLRNGEVVKNNGSFLNGSFNNLLSNNEYLLKVSYSYDLNDGNGVHNASIDRAISTESKTIPNVSIYDEEITDTSIKANFLFDDPDSIGYVSSVKIYDSNNNLVSQSADSIDFNDLEYYSNYNLKIYYDYDSNDGTGIQHKIFNKTIKTAPHLDFDSCRIVNTSSVSEGDTIYMQVDLDNPHGATPTSIIVNGEYYNCAQSTTPNKIFAEIVNNGQFEGGNTTLKIDKLNMELDNQQYVIIPTSNNIGHIFINGKLSVTDVYFADTSFEKVDYGLYSNDYVCVVELENSTGYSIDQISYFAKVPHYSEYVVTKTDLTFVNNSKLYFSIEPSIECGWNSIKLTNVSYSNENVNGTITLDKLSNLYGLKSDTIRYVDSPEDFELIEDYYHYELKNDISLVGIEWSPSSFKGVFDGKNHIISDLSLTKTFIDKDVTFGLFSEAEGVFENLKLKDSTILTTIEPTKAGEYSAKIGVLCGTTSGTLVVNNCHSIDSTISVNKKGDYHLSCFTVGGFVGGDYGSSGGMHYYEFNKCSSADFISLTCSSSSAKVGGFIGSCYPTSILFSNCISKSNFDCKYEYTGFISYVGGFIGNIHDGCTINNCISIASFLDKGYAFVGDTGHYGPLIIKNSISQNATLYDSTRINEFSNYVDFYQEIIYLDYQNTISPSGITFNKNYFISVLGWSTAIWNLDNVDISNGIYPTLK